MLDPRLIRTNPELVREKLSRRKEDVDLDNFLELDAQRRTYIGEVEKLKNRRNVVSQQIARFKKEKKDVDDIIKEMKQVSDTIKEYDDKIRDLEQQLNDILLSIPNIPHDSVPEGDSEEQNVEVRRWGQPKEFTFTPKAHWDIGEEHNILDFGTAGKVTGSRFAFFRGLGARLERALISFMLDVHTTQHGYVEYCPVHGSPQEHDRNRAAAKIEEDAFKIEGTDTSLSLQQKCRLPYTGRDSDGSKLPLKYVAYSGCFRSEAGAAGRDTRGLIRQHQFDKVELVKFVKPETSYDELEKLVADAEKILRLLGLPYRVVLMCTADLSFTAAKKYDLEVWMPSYNRYVRSLHAAILKISGP